MSSISLYSFDLSSCPLRISLLLSMQERCGVKHHFSKNRIHRLTDVVKISAKKISVMTILSHAFHCQLHFARLIIFLYHFSISFFYASNGAFSERINQAFCLRMFTLFVRLTLAFISYYLSFVFKRSLNVFSRIPKHLAY